MITDSVQTHYLYDGSFEGLLTLIYTLSKQKITNPTIIPSIKNEALLFANDFYIETEQKSARRLREAIEKFLPPFTMKRILFNYLSEIDGVETAIYNYLMLGWKKRLTLDYHITDSAVKQVHDVATRVICERHKMLGIIRFRQVNDLYYAPIEPDFNVVPLVGEHFVDRMAHEKWIIHDRKRNIAAISNRGTWELSELEMHYEPEYNTEEKYYQKLWNNYFQTIAISGRENKKLQRSFLPKRYWKHLVENVS